MKKCPKCSSDYPVNYAYCPIHGLMLIESGAPVTGQGSNAAVQGQIVAGAGNPAAIDPEARRKRNKRIILIVVAAVAILVVVPFLLILALVAIPTFGSMKKRANEAAAIQSLRAITQAEMQYQVMYPNNGFACPLGVLGGDPKSGPPDPSSSQLLQGDLTSGVKNGYIFNIVDCAVVFDSRRITSYKITAIPQRVGQTGDRGFCSDPSGLIEADPAGGTHCSQPVE